LDGDGVLRNKSKNNLIRLVVPKPYIQEVLSLNHDLPMTGHQGVNRTRARVKEKYYWCRMNKTIKAYVHSCNTCNKNKKATRKAKCPLTRYHAGVPFERVHIDFMGPLPETTKGNTNILVLVDQFTKWVEIMPLPSQTAEETTKALVDEVFTRFGCPLTIHIVIRGEILKAPCSSLFAKLSIFTKRGQHHTDPLLVGRWKGLIALL
jgi:hypothetical protein